MKRAAKYVRWTPENRQRVRELARSKTTAEIAGEMGVSRNSVWAILSAIGAPMGCRHTCWNARKDGALRKLVAEGRPSRLIAQELGCSRMTVIRRGRALGLKFCAKGGVSRRIDWERARKLAAEGYWLNEAARILRIHHTTAIYIGRQMGFTWPAAPAKPQRISLQMRVVRRERAEDSGRVERMMQLASWIRTPHSYMIGGEAVLMAPGASMAQR